MDVIISSFSLNISPKMTYGVLEYNIVVTESCLWFCNKKEHYLWQTLYNAYLKGTVSNVIKWLLWKNLALVRRHDNVKVSRTEIDQNNYVEMGRGKS